MFRVIDLLENLVLNIIKGSFQGITYNIQLSTICANIIMSKYAIDI